MNCKASPTLSSAQNSNAHSKSNLKRHLLSLFAPLLVFLMITGCSTFHNSGDGTPVSATGDDEEADSVGGIGPTLSLRGEREVIRPTEPINFDWPLDEARMTRGFLLGGKAHWGVDLANKKGTDILAAEKGVVVYTGRGFHGYGNLIVIEHNDEWATLYSHLSKITIKEGQSVTRGQKVGEMGRTGHATGVHLHFEIRHNRQPVNPLAYLPEGF